MFAVATDIARGFGARDLANFEQLSHALGAALEAAATHRIAETLLDTYVGHRSGRRILSGQIQRGAADVIEAAIWYADLRDFTALSEKLPSARLLEMLNAYFELVAQAVTPRGGEILRFMGDAMLILFPADKKGHLGAACAAAMDAALDAFARAETINHRRRLDSCPEIRFGVGLNAGQVVYGNVGAPDRLDFTVIGPAVNRARAPGIHDEGTRRAAAHDRDFRRRARAADTLARFAPDARTGRPGRGVRARDGGIVPPWRTTLTVWRAPTPAITRIYWARETR